MIRRTVKRNRKVEKKRTIGSISLENPSFIIFKKLLSGKAVGILKSDKEDCISANLVVFESLQSRMTGVGDSSTKFKIRTSQ